MSKLHPWEKYVSVAPGATVRATGTVDRRWPTVDHSVVDVKGKLLELSAHRLAFELEADELKLVTSAKLNFGWEASEPSPSGAVANTLQASGRLGFLQFSFDDAEVEFAEKDGALEIIADGKLDVTGPVDFHARMTLLLWKAGDKTRVRFQAVRKNGKLLGEGELTLS
jgi:hypothetical protein